MAGQCICDIDDSRSCTGIGGLHRENLVHRAGVAGIQYRFQRIRLFGGPFVATAAQQVYLCLFFAAEPEYAECRKGASGYSVGAVDLGRQRQTAVQERICNFEVNAAVDPANREYAGPPVGIGGRETFVSAGGIRCRGGSGAYASQYE